MSRKVTVNIVPRNAKDDKSLILAVIRQAGPNADVTCNLQDGANRPAAPHEPTQPNDQAAQRFCEAAETKLEQKAQQIAQQPAGEAKDAAAYARDLSAALKGLAAAGARFGRGIAAEVITTKAFEHLLQNYAAYIEPFRNILS